MKFSMDSQMQFPLVELSLNQGETVYIQRGSMVYHTPNVSLNTQLNASGSGWDVCQSCGTFYGFWRKHLHYSSSCRV